MMRISHLSVAVIGFAVLLAACGDSGSESTTTTAAAVTTTAPTTVTSTSSESTTTTAGVSTSAPASTATTTTSSSTTTSTMVTTTTEDPASRVTVIAVKWADGELVGGQEEYEVERDAVVEIVVTADVSDEVHVHGYDVFADVAPGNPGSVTFTASIPGIFEVEFEGSGLLLFDLIVS